MLVAQAGCTLWWMVSIVIATVCTMKSFPRRPVIRSKGYLNLRTAFPSNRIDLGLHNNSIQDFVFICFVCFCFCLFVFFFDCLLRSVHTTRNCVALPHCALLHKNCDVAALLCRMIGRKLFWPPHY